MCRVLNKHHAGVPAGAVYIRARACKWGNPFRIGPDGDRAAVKARCRMPGRRVKGEASPAFRGP